MPSTTILPLLNSRVIAFVMTLLVAISILTQGDAWNALAPRADSAGDDQRMFTAFTNAFDYFGAAGLFGFGAGSANLGAPALVGGVVPFSWLPPGMTFEEESGRLVVELGILGWFLSFCLRAMFLIWALRLVRTGNSHSIRAAALLALPVMGLALYQGNGVFAAPIWNAMFWFCVGILVMAQREQLSMQRAALPQGLVSSR